MKDSKRLLKTTILVLLLVLLGVELCMELRYPCKEAAVVSKDTEAILRRAPEVEITEENRAMVARGERLYAVTVGSLREQVAEMLDWYQRVLSSQEVLKIAKATRRLDAFFDRVEAYLGDAALPPPEPLDEEEEP